MLPDLTRITRKASTDPTRGRHAARNSDSTTEDTTSLKTVDKSPMGPLARYRMASPAPPGDERLESALGRGSVFCTHFLYDNPEPDREPG